MVLPHNPGLHGVERCRASWLVGRPFPRIEKKHATETRWERGCRDFTASAFAAAPRQGRCPLQGGGGEAGEYRILPKRKKTRCGKRGHRPQSSFAPLLAGTQRKGTGETRPEAQGNRDSRLKSANRKVRKSRPTLEISISTEQFWCYFRSTAGMFGAAM